MFENMLTQIFNDNSYCLNNRHFLSSRTKRFLWLISQHLQFYNEDFYYGIYVSYFQTNYRKKFKDRVLLS